MSIKKYIKKRNQIVKVLQETKLEKYIGNYYAYDPDDPYIDTSKIIDIEIDFNQACQCANLILQKMGMNKPNQLKELEKSGYLKSYTSNRELNKKRLK